MPAKLITGSDSSSAETRCVRKRWAARQTLYSRGPLSQHRRSAGTSVFSPIIRTPPALAVACLLPLLWLQPARASDSALEYAIKATYLYKIPQFVSWPPGTLPPTAFRLCVVGRHPFGGVLDQAVRGQMVQQRPIVVRRYRTITANPGCQLMYVAGSADQSVASVLAMVRGQPVLTVTDGQTDRKARGIINFVLAQGRVRFQISARAAAANGLAISSKLLSLAFGGRS
ncbi:MAG: YfiR family protein [Proteobacteria bacterium]|nr:YfiR family protein [Pseudomonadota bacterium]